MQENIQDGIERIPYKRDNHNCLTLCPHFKNIMVASYNCFKCLYHFRAQEIAIKEPDKFNPNYYNERIKPVIIEGVVYCLKKKSNGILG